VRQLAVKIGNSGLKYRAGEKEKMKGKIGFFILSCLLALSVILASCSTKSTSTTTLTNTPKNTQTLTSTPTSKPNTPTITTTNPTTATTGNWWDKLGKPQYGGEIVIRGPQDIVEFDPYVSDSYTSIECCWMERLIADDWTVDPAVFDYKMSFRPAQYAKGLLAESWEFPDSSTMVFHLRKGIHYQNIPPVNGREFTADDVVFHYQRLYGLGSGITPPSYYFVSILGT
jgi:ABC-type transport system substrate-binding protein